MQHCAQLLLLSVSRGSGIRKCWEGFTKQCSVESLLLKPAGILSGWKVVVSERVRAVEIACDEVRRELVDYMEEDLKMDLRMRIDQHLENCQHCTAIYDGVRNVVELVGAQGSIELPRGFTQRLYRRFLNQIK